jgi:F0F1-type ATP synthase assembly protein I
VIPSPESRSPLALGMEWATKISVIATEFVVPMVLGYFLDRAIGSSPLFMLVGSLCGFLLGTIHSIKLAVPGRDERTGSRVKRSSIDDTSSPDDREHDRLSS